MGREQSTFLGLKISAGYAAVLINVFFSALAVLGQVGQNVSLPLWAGATGAIRQPNCSNNTDDDSMVSSGGGSGEMPTNGSAYQPEMDPYFILSFASLSFVIVFGTITAIITVLQYFVNNFHSTKVNWISVENDLKFPQWQLCLIGVFDALNGVFVVFASSPARVAPFLQAILGNFIIPLTIVFRLVLLRKKPTLVKLIASIVVLLGLLISLIPVMSGMDEDSKEGNKLYLKQSRASQILWPLCFMFGFCFFGGAGCTSQPGLSGTSFIVMYLVSYLGGGLLLRYAEGATYLAVVQALVTPLGALFWSIFSLDECSIFHVHPHAGSLTYFSIGGMVIMVPAIFLYNIGSLEAIKALVRRVPSSAPVYTTLNNENDPLLFKQYPGTTQATYTTSKNT